jgi:HemY protein
MVRVVVYLLIVALIAAGAVWLAERPGEVIITWQGQRLDTSVMVLLVTIAAIAVATTLLWSVVRFIVRSPGMLARARERSRGLRGYRAVSQGLIAVGAGDVGAAKKFTDEARRIAPAEPLTLLLSAQTAQLSGERSAAVRTFEEMAGRGDTKMLGLHGLYIEARRRNDPRAALLYAEEAAKQEAVPPWAGQAVLEFRSIAGDWSGAIERLERNYTSGLIDKTAYRRQRAVLLTAQALASEETDRDRAKALVLEAVKLAPTFVPAAALAGRLLGEAGELRKAARIIEAAWVWNPHPDLAEAAAHLRPGDSARERLTRIEALAAKSAPGQDAPGKAEAALAVARSAIDAQEFAKARETLAPLLAAPTRRVAALMAELEMRQGDEGRAREWMARALTARRDPAWTADGFVSDRWLPVSPVTGRLDAFEWRDPLAGDHAGTVIEAEQRAVLEAPREVPREGSGEGVRELRAPEPPPKPAVDEVREATDVIVPSAASHERTSHPANGGKQPEAVAPPSPEPRAAPASDSQPREQLPSHRAGGVTPVPLAPAVIPLVHAPDDPGPEPESQIEPHPEPTAEPPTHSWSKIRQLFRP